MLAKSNSFGVAPRTRTTKPPAHISGSYLPPLNKSSKSPYSIPANVNEEFSVFTSTHDTSSPLPSRSPILHSATDPVSAFLSSTAKNVLSKSTLSGLLWSHRATYATLWPTNGDLNDSSMGASVPSWPPPSGFFCGADA